MTTEMTELQVMLCVFIQELYPDAMTLGWNKSGRGICIDNAPVVQDFDVINAAWAYEMPGHELVLKTTQVAGINVLIDAQMVTV